MAGELLAGGDEGEGPPKLRDPNGWVEIGCELNILGAASRVREWVDNLGKDKLTSSELVWDWWNWWDR